MRYQTDFAPQHLANTPRMLQIGLWTLQYLAFSRYADDRREPILMLGGAFQSFRSFGAEVQELLPHHPVILLDLPSQGCNLQLAPELSLEQLADLVAAFADELELPPLMPIGLSYGSALAALFAVRHPRHCARLLLAGITAFGRPGARRMLEESLELLAEGQIVRFAQGALTGLINPLRLEETGISRVFRKALLRQMQRLSPQEIERYRQNSRRLLDFTGFEQHPACPTLVLAGEYDHFTQPWEHAGFAAACADADCALIHNGDHLAQFEQREACASFYRPFLQGTALPLASPGATRLARNRLAHLERRQEARVAPLNRRGRLLHAEAGEWSVDVSELGFFGGRVQGDLPADLPSRGWQLRAGDLPALDALPLRHDGDSLALVFPHTEAEASEALAAQVVQAEPRAAAYA
ncbi:alpha/beta fold hydrolase [Pseudomonas sp. TCU-HL1]|uniref:alpha/beta fold hydrolase n=1 Tax=Pseudomonas sp. TCU-HL1 TaxID=1856685 RepID=UPI00083D429E|nr:alpha/beta hydrolase [Pseudomonas sp. TCU-HL1]AOE83390.1 alpha/beta hydrolase [Pseudomonas sp. TCU-HL1]